MGFRWCTCINLAAGLALALALSLACGGGGGGSTPPDAPVVTSFQASPGTITAGGSANLTAVFSHGTGTISPGDLTVTSGVPVTVHPTTTTGYTLTVTGTGGAQATRSDTVTVLPMPTIASFDANPATVAAGMAVTLTAVFRDGTGIINPGNLPVSSSVPVTVHPTTATTYTLTVSNALGANATRDAAVAIFPVPTISSFGPTPAIIAPGASANLTAVYSDGAGVITPGDLAIASGGSVTVSPASSTTYTLTVIGPGGTASHSADLAIVPNPTISGFSASPTAIAAGASTSLTATFQDGTGRVTPGDLAISSGVPLSVQPTATTNYVLTVTAASGANTSRTITVTVTRTVSGNQTVTYLPFDATTGVITPTTVVPINDFDVVLADGQTHLMPTYDNATGNFTVTPVPTGHYWLRVGSTYTWTDRNVVDLGSNQPGRTTVHSGGMNTGLTFTASGLAPYQSGNYLNLYDFNARFNAYPRLVDGSPQSIARLDCTSLPLIDTTQGDRPLLVEGVDAVTGTQHLTTAQLSALSAPLTMTDGTDTPMAAVFSALPMTTSLTLNYRRSAVANLRPDWNPNAQTTWGPFLEFDAMPGASQYGPLVDWLELVVFQDSNRAQTSDPAPSTVSATSLPPGFEWIAYLGESYYMDYQLPGTIYPYRGKIWACRAYTLTLPDASHPLAPIVGPPRTPTINGLSLFSDQADVSLTPTLAWSAPSLGTPTRYDVYVYQLSAVGSYTVMNDIATFRMDGSKTAVTLPDGILAPGQTYFFIITAYQAEGFDPASAPFRMGFPYGRSSTASCLVTTRTP